MTTSLFAEVEARRIADPGVAKAIREAAHVSQRQIARELGVHYLTVLRWEHGERVPRGTYLLAYADLLRRLAEVA